MKTKFFSNILRVSVLLPIVLAVVLPTQGVLAAGTRRYARPGGATSGDCLTWKTACELRYVLGSVAVAGDQIWVRQGIYTPDGSSRANSFILQNGVAIYGGFAGSETLLSQRKPSLNITVLSGDIGAPGNSSDNSYHVITSSGVDGTAVLDGFTITGGNANSGYPASDGGGMYNDNNSSPTLRNLIFSGNTAAADGGGLANDNGGSPLLINVTFAANTAGNFGGGMYSYQGNPVLKNVRFSTNVATWFGGGMYSDNGNPSLTAVRFNGNSADTGGGMYNANSSNSRLTSVSFRANWAGNGGGIYNDNSNPVLNKVIFSGNSANNGGGMFNSTSNPTLTNTTFSYNTANSDGGGMRNDTGSPVLNRVTFSNNSAGSSGGGMQNINGSSPTLRNVTFSGNAAAVGGGMLNDGGSAVLIGVTFSGNSATGDGGGMENETSSTPSLRNVTFSGNSAGGNGGAIDSYFSTPSLNNVTISGNSAALGGGAIGNNSGSNLIVHNSILWGNGASEIYNESSNITMDYSILKGGCPLSDTSFACGHVMNKNPMLAPLANNGGFTRTMALLAGSPAIDHGNNATCEKLDQRGIARPQGPGCELGAFEFVP